MPSEIWKLTRYKIKLKTSSENIRHRQPHIFSALYGHRVNKKKFSQMISAPDVEQRLLFAAVSEQAGRRRAGEVVHVVQSKSVKNRGDCFSFANLPSSLFIEPALGASIKILHAD